MFYSESYQRDLMRFFHSVWEDMERSNVKDVTVIEKSRGIYDFIDQVLNMSMKSLKIDIKVPVCLSAILSISTQRNPGISKVMLGEIVRRAGIKEFPYVVKVADYDRVFRDEYPMFSDIEAHFIWNQAWKGQKLSAEGVRSKGTDNAVDTRDYWICMINGDRWPMVI